MAIIRRILRLLPALLVSVGMLTVAAGLVLSAERESFVVQFDEAGVSSLKVADDSSTADYIAEHHTLGHVRVRYQMGRNTVQEFHTADPANRRWEPRRDPRDSTPQFAVSYNLSGWTDYFADLEVTERFRLEPDSLYWSIHIRNPTHKPIEIYSIYLPLPFDSRAERRTIVARGQSYPYWTQPGGEGPFLVMTPVARCPLFEPTTSERNFALAKIERLDKRGIYVLPVPQGSILPPVRGKFALSPKFTRNGRTTLAFRFRRAATLDEVRVMVEGISREVGTG